MLIRPVAAVRQCCFLDLLLALCALMLLSVLPGHACADASAVAELSFASVRLGQSPDDDMFCVRGPCRPDGQRTDRTFIPAYKKRLDVTQIDDLEITAPRYDFYDNRLFSIGFYLDCAPDRGDAAIDALLSYLDRQYATERLLDSALGTPHTYDRIIRLRAGQGAVIEISWRRQTGRGQPHVRIYDKKLMDQVRITANPGYVPRSLAAVY